MLPRRPDGNSLTGALRPLRAAAARTVRSPKLVLLLAPLLVFWPFLFGGYSLSQNPAGLEPGTPYLGFSIVPIADPAASALLDEPHLVDLKRHLARGRVPLLDMQNGLGARGVESLLTGSLYVLNPVLFLLPTGSPLYYDLFQLLHVYICLIGLYYLLRFYVPPFAAVATSVVVVLSGVTYLWINMMQYRNFAWTPLMIAAAVGLARRQAVRRRAWLLFAAAVAGGTAGNVQEFAMGLVATAVVYATEAWVAGRPTPRSAAAFPLCLVAAVCVSMITLLPYLASLRAGELWVTNGPDRSVRPYDPVWLLSWVVPRLQGFYPNLFIGDGPYWPHADLSTTGFLLLVLGVMFAWRRPALVMRTPRSAVAAVVAIVIPLGLAKVVSLPVLSFVRYVPFVREVFFAKYHLYLFALAAIPIAVGLDHTAGLEPAQRRRQVKIAVTVVGTVLAGIAVYLNLRTNYRFWSQPRSVVFLALGTYAVSLGVFLAAAALLCWQPRGWRVSLLCLLVAQSTLLLPPGFQKRKSAYPRTFGGGEYADQAIRKERLLIREIANSNLFWDVESVALDDPIVSARYRRFFNAFLSPMNSYFMYQPTGGVLDATQVRALRLLGTRGVFGYKLRAPGQARKLGPRAFALREPLPRLFLVSEDTARALEGVNVTPDSIDPTLELLLRDVRSLPQPYDVQRNGTTVRYHIHSRARGRLVLNQSYSRWWRSSGSVPDVFLDLWPSWRVREGQGGGTISYSPAGLGPGLAVALGGLALMVALDLLLLRARARTPTPDV